MSKHGFSLLELLVVISIISMTVILTVPAYQFIFKKSTSQILSARLLRAIQMARSEAMTRGIPVTLCKSKDHTTCSGAWQDGQILFVDEKQNGIVADKADVLYIFDKNFSGTLNWRSSLKRDYLQFLPSGLTAGENGTFSYSPADTKNPGWKIVVNQAGRARLQWERSFS